MYELDGPKFFRLAYRITAYQGAMAARQSERNDDKQNGGGRVYEPNGSVNVDSTVDGLSAINRQQTAGGASPIFDVATV